MSVTIPQISIIIPVYKAEKYVARAIDSVLSQTFTDYEIICVNDGSPDNSLEILENYAEKYDKIRIINKQNEGVWRARLDGVFAARGEYIAFLDADDYIDSDCLNKLYTTAVETQSDITVCGFCRIDNTTSHVYSREMCGFGSSVIYAKQTPEKLLEINSALWNKLYRSSLFNNVEDLNSRPRALEDAILLMQLYRQAETVTFIPEPLYQYMIIDGSTMQTLDSTDVTVIENALLELKQMYEKVSSNDGYMDLLSAMAFIHLGVSIMLRRYISKDKGFGKELKRNRAFLKKNFPKWKRSKCLSLRKALFGKGNLKSAVMKHIYSMHLIRPFLFFYVFITQKIKLDIKW